MFFFGGGGMLLEELLRAILCPALTKQNFFFVNGAFEKNISLPFTKAANIIILKILLNFSNIEKKVT
jgi:hypothetical protein